MLHDCVVVAGLCQHIAPAWRALADALEGQRDLRQNELRNEESRLRDDDACDRRQGVAAHQEHIERSEASSGQDNSALFHAKGHSADQAPAGPILRLG